MTFGEDRMNRNNFGDPDFLSKARLTFVSPLGMNWSNSEDSLMFAWLQIVNLVSGFSGSVFIVSIWSLTYFDMMVNSCLKANSQVIDTAQRSCQTSSLIRDFASCCNQIKQHFFFWPFCHMVTCSAFVPFCFLSWGRLLMVVAWIISTTIWYLRRETDRFNLKQLLESVDKINGLSEYSMMWHTSLYVRCYRVI